MRWLPVIAPPAADARTDGERTAVLGATAPGAAVREAVEDRGAGAPRASRVYLEVFGCQMNKLDSELMLGVLADAGYRLTADPHEAGVVLFNTCAVRQHAEDRVFSRVGQLKALGRHDPDLVVGVLGCSAQNLQREILERHPHVGIVCGPGEFLRLPELIDRARRGERVLAVDLGEPVRFERRRNGGPRAHHAYVSVMRGCDMACTYCIVPRTRGPEVSRPVREIIDEAKALADSGVREITLLGQTVNSYGKRLGPGRKIGLQHVLYALDRIEGLERIRFITSHPRFMRTELIDAMAGLEKVCEYLHLPVQSGSDTVLRRMLRSYSVRHYLKVVEQCREKIAGLSLATDCIVGFPGETEDEFQETVRLMENVRFQGAFVFKYSERPGTVAAHMADDVPDAVKRERNQAILALQKAISLEWNRAAIGTTLEVLVDGPSRQDARRWSGRSRAYQIVVFPISGGEDLTGKLVPVRITDATPLVLVGELEGPAR